MRLCSVFRFDSSIDTSFGKARIGVVCGQCKSTRGWETPFRDRLFRGEHGAVSPALERKVVTTVCETGSFEKAATVCGAWGCELSDDKAMATIRRVGDACDPALLPKLCDCAAGEEDTLIVMMDGWLARFKEAKWGRPRTPHALADALFPKESQKDEKEAWTHRLLKNLKTWGPKTLMDAFTDDPFKVGVPFGDYYFRQTVDHLDVRSNVSGVTSGDDFSNGCIEFWASNYAPALYDAAWGGSGSTFDWNDSGFGTGVGGYGSMQVHRYGSEAAGEILWCFNEFNKSQKASWGIGRNPNPTAQQDFDWTFTKGNNIVSKFYAFVIPAASDPVVAPDNRVTRTIASTSGDKIAVRFAYEADAAAVAAATFTLDGGVTVTDAKKSDDPLWVVLKTSPLTAGQGYTLTIDGLTRPDGSIQSSFTATVTALTAEQAGLPAGVTSIPEIADGSYKLVQRLDIPLSSATVYKDTLYTVDEEYFGAIPFDRVAYCLDLTKTDGTRTWVYVSMDAFTHDVSKIGVPTYERGVEYQQKVANMNVYASEGANVTTGTGIETGNIEFWPQNYSEGNSLLGLGGRGDKYDYDDTRNGFGYGFGSMQVHNYGAGETIFAYNQFGPANAVPQLGIGNDPNMGTGSIGSDWTHDTNGESFSSRVLYILVRDAGAVSTGDGPEIILQPQIVVCKRRETAVLSVRSGGAVGYQWYHNGVAMEGETGDTLTIASADKADGGTYTVAAISAKGVTMSAPARVTVILDGTIMILR